MNTNLGFLTPVHLQIDVLSEGGKGCVREDSFTHWLSTQLPRPPAPALNVNGIVNKVGATLVVG